MAIKVMANTLSIQKEWMKRKSLLVGFILSKINLERDGVFTAAVKQVRRVLLNRELQEKNLGLKVCYTYHLIARIRQSCTVGSVPILSVKVSVAIDEMLSFWRKQTRRQNGRWYVQTSL